MHPPGVIINAHAGRVRRDPGFADRLRARLPKGHVQVTSRIDEVEPALREPRDLGVDTVVIVGGDGSVGGTLTPLLRVWPEDALPRVALAAGGTVNTIPQSLGSHAHPENTIDHLLRGEPPRTQTQRPAVRVQPEGGEARCGMIFGNGVTTRWLEAYYANPSQGVLGALQVVGRAVSSALAGGKLSSSLFEPFTAKCEIDGQALEMQEFTVIGVGGVRDVGLGFRPFLTAGEDLKRVHLLATNAGALRLSAELPGLWLGRRGSLLQHHSAGRISIRFETAQPWSIDADLFPPAQVLEIGPTAPLHFIAP